MKKPRPIRLVAVIACILLTAAGFFALFYIPATYDLPYVTADPKLTKALSLLPPQEKQVWIYVPAGPLMLRERISLPCTAENLFLAWKHLNGIGGEVMMALILTATAMNRRLPRWPRWARSAIQRATPSGWMLS